MKAGEKAFMTRSKARRYANARPALKVFDRQKRDGYNGSERWAVTYK